MLTPAVVQGTTGTRALRPSNRIGRRRALALMAAAPLALSAAPAVTAVVPAPVGDDLHEHRVNGFTGMMVQETSRLVSFLPLGQRRYDAMLVTFRAISKTAADLYGEVEGERVYREALDQFRAEIEKARAAL